MTLLGPAADETLDMEGVAGGLVDPGRDWHNELSSHRTRQSGIAHGGLRVLEYLNLTRSNKYTVFRLTIEIPFSLDRTIILTYCL